MGMEVELSMNMNAHEWRSMICRNDIRLWCDCPTTIRKSRRWSRFLAVDEPQTGPQRVSIGSAASSRIIGEGGWNTTRAGIWLLVTSTCILGRGGCSLKKKKTTKQSESSAKGSSPSVASKDALRIPPGENRTNWGAS